ncbi:hypothetical protein QVD17_36312 [Tagetes erecta]|uniref:Uncharacterized protein n=1 Tax=Tagetes erecta TaxID=13708 RepID=A0AAD8JU56_TARER|nr:hypothetical protein QVD17_36312 [Tagetes erecta]
MIKDFTTINNINTPLNLKSYLIKAILIHSFHIYFIGNSDINHKLPKFVLVHWAGTMKQAAVLILVTMMLCSCLVVQGRAHKEAVVYPDGFIDNHHNIPRQNYNSQAGASGDGDAAGGDTDINNGRG